ncbi:hypothetical protein M9458_008272 [Cirrhinus mrigala]|uniref:Uncharacterized protein n=1 Tax=Cirrhinus mrigala TaxID=683832 RepID=A0ABD0R851_CIRMR
MYSVHRQKNGIYANISLFLSYSEVTLTTRSSLYPDQMVTAVLRIKSIPGPDGGSAPRDDRYSPECQRRPHRLDEPQRRIPSEDLVTYKAVGTGPREPDERTGPPTAFT